MNLLFHFLDQKTMIPVQLSNSDLYQILLQKATPSFSNYTHRSSVKLRVLIHNQIGL